MAREVRSEVEIRASAETVWRILTDFESYPVWNPFVRRAEGSLTVGSQLRISLQVFSGRLTTFEPRVTIVQPPYELGWHAQTGPRGAMDVDRGFRIEEVGDGAVRFHMWETCTGFLVPLMFGPLRMGTRLEDGYDRMNAAIRSRAQTGATAQA